MKLIGNMRFILSEIFSNTFRIGRLSWYNFISRDQDSSLGIIWTFLYPVIQIAIFWIVFGIGLRRGAEVGGYEYVVWLVCGIVPWFYFSEGITQGSGAFFSQSSIVTRMKFPLSIIPVCNIITALYPHIICMAIVLVFLLLKGVFLTVYAFQVLYYMLASTCYLISLAFLTSSISMISKDFHKFLLAFMRMIFYLTPVIFILDRLPAWSQTILKINPLFYLIEGYRGSLLYNEPFWAHPLYTAYFWGVTLLFWVIGSNIHMKFRKNFVDVL